MLILERSAAERCGPASPSSDRTKTWARSEPNPLGTRVRIVVEQSFIGVIQRAMKLRKPIATVVAAQQESIAAQCGLHAQSRSVVSPRGSPGVQPLLCASLTALLHEPPRFPAVGGA